MLGAEDAENHLDSKTSQERWTDEEPVTKGLPSDDPLPLKSQIKRFTPVEPASTQDASHAPPKEAGEGELE